MSRYRSRYGSTYGSYGSYGSYGGRSYGQSYGRTVWSYDWGSFYGSSLVEDNSHLFVKEPGNYATPSETEIQRKASVYTKVGIDMIKELARVCYFKMIDDRDYLAEKYKDLDQLSDEEKEDYESKKPFYDAVYENFIPGFTPLEQAIAIYEKAAKGDPQYISREEIMEGMEESSTLKFNREIYFDADINDQLEINPYSKNRKMSILNKLSIIGDLGSQFKVEKEVDEKIVSNSDITAKKMMRDYSQMAQIELYQKLLPNFSAKLLTKDLVVNVPVERKEQKQKIIILLDYSGSMSDEYKQDWVNAMLIDRFRYVMKGEAEVFFSYFVYNIGDLHFKHIKDRQDVLEFWSTFSNFPNGGTTDVGAMVKHVSKEILERKKLHNLQVDLSEEKPEILIINDGEDTIHAKNFPYKVNAICLGTYNDYLKKLCVDTHGKKVYVDWDSNIVSYSESGEEKVV